MLKIQYPCGCVTVQSHINKEQTITFPCTQHLQGKRVDDFYETFGKLSHK
jgi:hypothetical protein